ncbi:hypothetical protein NEF87_004539 [Candidatus Lokiarchaeum ossiferum]|uniref:ECF transporter S component n=1 Tax=Candidatus Lokiarchaeum ossiferum TaxID=2951803 RepID=A0ABY6I0M3_9ARCH|nr:hypothetical protein NEF87_004539 [Candidatus Lokiarchaeum sp. B-35]
MSNLSLESNESLAPLRSSETSKKSRITLDIAGAAIFSALSVVLSLLTTEMLPRMAWGIAYFDPVSIIWLTAFLVFGFRCGIFTAIIGSIGLMFFDPTPFVGPVMKFVATIWLMIVPYFIIQLSKRRTLTGQDMKKKKFYIQSALIAWGIRSVVMIALNYLYIAFVFGGVETIPFYDMSWIGLGMITSNIAIIISVFLLNTIQTIADVFLPYWLIFSTKIYDHFQIY